MPQVNGSSKLDSLYSFGYCESERLEKAQIRVIEGDILTSSSLVHAESYAEVYLDDEEFLSSESDIDSDSKDKKDYTQDILNVQSIIAQVKRAIYNSLWKY
ncbi:9651_t:CDS:2 [Cetraspora pellucida]|uniref:9651_t:CDS:1 n=1 Tax=Cetraspora pellucida TaxID=1433469 RepID=A0ACA9K4D3_9GLOM|nr:9651_t:CDS:2 [Cetraspora pellucida]